MIKKLESILRFFDVKKFLGLKKKYQIGIVTGVVFIMLCSFLLIHSSKEKIHDLPTILDTGRLTVLTDSSSNGFSVNGGVVSGFQYEIIKAFADTLGVELVISEQNDFKNGIDGLKSGDYDIIASFTPITTEWKKDVQFTNPIFASRQVLVQRVKSDSLQSQIVAQHLQLANDTIYIPRNSPFKMRLQNLSNEIASPIEIVEMKNMSSEQMVHLVAIGKIKSTICDELFAQKLKQKYPNIDISLPIGFIQQQAWVVHPKSTKLLEKLNEFLDDFIGSSDYWRIYRKYYN
jgi:membrane-bound lytic murein transglycosylase MltF